jgi:hypothetical protein
MGTADTRHGQQYTHKRAATAGRIATQPRGATSEANTRERGQSKIMKHPEQRNGHSPLTKSLMYLFAFLFELCATVSTCLQ